MSRPNLPLGLDEFTTREARIFNNRARLLLAFGPANGRCPRALVKFQQRYAKSHRKVPPTPSHLPCELSWLPASSPTGPGLDRLFISPELRGRLSSAPKVLGGLLAVPNVRGP